VRDKSTEEISQILDVDISTIKRWISNGLPCDRAGRGKPCRLDATEVAAWMREKGLTGKLGRPKTETAKELEAARIRKENALADRYELDVAVRRGELLERVDVERMNVQKVAALRNALLSLPASLSPSLEGCSGAEIQDELERAVLGLLEQFARG
jgi:phage terminase Nu1 subunit (DNA packaging protein)